METRPLPSPPGLALALAAAAAALAARPAAAAPVTYAVDAAASRIQIHVDKAGLLSFAGHEHFVQARLMNGHIVADSADWSKSTVKLAFPANGVRVVAEKEPEGDAPKVQEAMEDKVLAIDTYPTITFTSTAVRPGDVGPTGGSFTLYGELTLRGVTRPLVIPAEVKVAPDRLTAKGSFALKQTDFGIEPVTSAAGTVRVRDEISLTFTLVAVPTARPGG